MLLFQVAGRGIILLLQRCRRPAVDVESTASSSAADEDSNDYGDSEDIDDEDDLMFRDPVAAPNPPVVAVPGILLYLFQIILSSIEFAGNKPRGGVKYPKYPTLGRLGDTLTR